MQNIHIETLKSVRQMLDTLKFQTVLKKEKALNPLRLKASEMAPPVGLEPRTHTVRNIVALQGDAPKCEHLGERTRCVMNEFSPKAKASDMEPPRTRSASQCSLFLPAQSTASSAAGSAVLRAS